MKYALSNDARARSVAKDLARLAKERGVKLPLTSAQNVTSRLFGYSDWQDLLASIGQGQRGPEDHELSTAAAAERRAHQIETLVSAGFGADATEILDALRPTGREQASIESKPRVWPIQVGGDHHPNRLSDVLEGFMNNGWDRSYSHLEEIMEEWTSKRFVHPLDRAAYSGDWVIEGLIMTCDHFRNGTGHVVDVSAIVSDQPDTGILTEKWKNLAVDPSGIERYYFHFGNHRFASPFKDIGIDGCYVTVWDEEDDDLPASVDFTFTTSPEIAVGSEDVLFDSDRELDFRSVLRTVEIGFSPLEGQPVGVALAEASGSEHSEEYVDAWRPYLEKPLCAAWTALKAYRARTGPIYNALYVDSFEEDFAKLERAATDKAIVDRMRQIAENSEDLPVRFMGRTPPAEDVCRDEMAAAPYPVRGSGPDRYDMDHVRSKLADALDMWRPWSTYLCAEEALRMCADLDPTDPATQRAVLKANAFIMNGAHMVEEHDRALEAALEVHRSPLPEVVEYLPGAVIVFVDAGREDEARSAAARLEKLARPGAPIVAVATMLVLAKFSKPQIIETATMKLVALFPDVTQRLLTLEVDPWGWFFRDGAAYEDEADQNDHAACMFRKPLKLAGAMAGVKRIFDLTNEPEAASPFIH